MKRTLQKPAALLERSVVQVTEEEHTALEVELRANSNHVVGRETVGKGTNTAGVQLGNSSSFEPNHEMT
jgi:hypothetical protein